MADTTLSQGDAGESKLHDHERRITALEQGMSTIQIKLVEVQTEGRMRGERQDKDLTTITAMTRDLLGGMTFFKAAFKWGLGFVFSILAFLAIYGDKLLTFYRDFHP